jgi:hypothetical protein
MSASEIVNRLRNGVLYDDEGEILRVATKALMRQAADRLSELERENAALRGALSEIVELSDRGTSGDSNYSQGYMDGRIIPGDIARAALAGSGEK